MEIQFWYCDFYSNYTNIKENESLKYIHFLMYIYDKYIYGNVRNYIIKDFDIFASKTA